MEDYLSVYRCVLLHLSGKMKSRIGQVGYKHMHLNYSGNYAFAFVCLCVRLCMCDYLGSSNHYNKYNMNKTGVYCYCW